MLLFVLVSQFWVLSGNFLKELYWTLSLQYFANKNGNCAKSVLSDSLWPHGTVAQLGPLSMGFSRLECWSELPCPAPRDFPTPGAILHWQMGSLPLAPPGKPKNAIGPGFFLLSILFILFLCLIVFHSWILWFSLWTMPESTEELYSFSRSYFRN